MAKPLKAPVPDVSSEVVPPPINLLSHFPSEVSDFSSDPRISYSRPDSKWLLETESGLEYEYIETLKRWVPTVDESLVEKQQAAYAVAGEDAASDDSDRPQKRKQQDDNSSNGPKPKKAKPTKPAPERKNTAVYVTNLPSDVSVAEVASIFSRCGVIAEEIDSGKPRVKLYNDEHGAFKGEALIVYFRGESVNLAVQMLDDTDFRLGEPGMWGGRMRVQVADFSYKKQQEVPTLKDEENKKSEAAKQKLRAREKVKKKTQKLNSKLADWDDDDPSTMHQSSNRWDKVVILKHMFTLEELAKDPSNILDIKEDIRDECSKLGNVTNVVLFDGEADGVASVRYGDEEAARACVRLMDGRFFGGTKVEAYIADGSEKFRKNVSEGKVGLKEDD